ncbi:hypothetical protein ACKF11_08760 [Methylobacillus sp. Pita2]|uniref:hypothetical protein n=1 Tax=Methylobacillus sp. Pita2 TaxID=3383245 RepID=UPI0038B51679
MSNKSPSMETIQKVADECERLSINMLSGYQMVRALIQELNQQSDSIYQADILSQFLKSAARDLEDITEVLAGKKTGFYELEFGSVLDQEKELHHG